MLPTISAVRYGVSDQSQARLCGGLQFLRLEPDADRRGPETIDALINHDARHCSRCALRHLLDRQCCPDRSGCGAGRGDRQLRRHVAGRDSGCDRPGWTGPGDDGHGPCGRLRVGCAGHGTRHSQVRARGVHQRGGPIACPARRRNTRRGASGGGAHFRNRCRPRGHASRSIAICSIAPASRGDTRADARPRLRLRPGETRRVAGVVRDDPVGSRRSEGGVVCRGCRAHHRRRHAQRPRRRTKSCGPSLLPCERGSRAPT